MVIKSESSSKYTFRLSSPPRVARQFVNWGRCTRLTTSQMQKDQHEITFGWSWWWQFLKRKQQNYEHKCLWQLFKWRWNNKGIGCAQHTCFYPPQFPQGSQWRRQRQASHSFKITHLIVFELHFYIPTNKTTNKVDQADQVDSPSNTDRAFESAREQLRPLSWCCFVWKFPTRISSPDPRRPGKGRRRCPSRHSPTTGCPRKILISEISGSQIHIWQLWTINVPRDIRQLLGGVPKKFRFL